MSTATATEPVTETVVAEVANDNQLVRIVAESGLEQTKAQVILAKFKDFFDLAGKWELKARTLQVTDASQTTEMKMAREGRLFLRSKRIEIENTRKQLKEQALREGKAIDGIANVLKGLIEPVEEYLERQEKFIEIQEAEKAEARRIEAERLLQEKEAAEAKARAEEQERMRKENERLRAEAAEHVRQAQIERQKQEKLLAEQKAKVDAERRTLEAKARKEREEAEAKQRELQAKAAAERKAIEAKARAEREAAEAAAREAKRIAAEKQAKLQAKIKAEQEEKRRLEEALKAMIECPKCHHRFTPEAKK